MTSNIFLVSYIQKAHDNMSKQHSVRLDKCGVFINVVVAEVASILVGFDIRQLTNATAFRKCWYRKSLMEAILFGRKPVSQMHSTGNFS